MMYDLIGDIHGYAEPLKELLHKMDYREKSGVWQHPSRKVIFVGDYLDRGPAIRETLQIVRGMHNTGNAIALMGNHEYNALAYAYALPDGTHLRVHNPKNNKQHSTTLREFEAYPNEWQDYLVWFYNLPLFLELPGLRAVHACWDNDHIKWLKDNGYELLKEELLVNSHKKGTYEYAVINDVLKGKEYTIPEQYAWLDKEGNRRTENRYRWWMDPKNCTLGTFLFHCPPALQEQMIEKQIQTVVYPADAPPVFFGHYWLEDAYPVIQTGNVVCLDFSIARGGHLVAYRWNGEAVVNNQHFVHVTYRSPTLQG